MVLVNRPAASDTAPEVKPFPEAKSENALPALLNNVNQALAVDFKALIASNPDVGKLPSLGALATVV